VNLDVEKVKLEIGNFLGFCDLNGVEAIQTEQVQKLEEYITACNEKHNLGEELVVDAIYNKLMDILSKVNPESELCKHIWEDSVDEFEDTDYLVMKNPMYSIQTAKSYTCDEICGFVRRLDSTETFDAHLSVKLNGHGIRVKYSHGEFIQARSRARSSAGRDLTQQLRVALEKSDLVSIPDIDAIPLCEIRGEWLLPLTNLNEAKQFNDTIVSAFTAVSSMGRDSASEEEWGLLTFVAYEFIADGVYFSSKEEEYDFLQSLGFEVPYYLTIEELAVRTFLIELPDLVEEFKQGLFTNGEYNYDYYTDGIVLRINDNSHFQLLGDDGGRYKYGNLALKVGFWEQNYYHGYIQTILWTKGKTKLSPVAIIAEEDDIIEFNDYDAHLYITNPSVIKNYKKLGVVTAAGNKVRRVPLFEPSNMLALNAYKGSILHFRYGGEAGVVPCYEDGTPLLEGRVKQLLERDKENEDWEDEYEDVYVDEIIF